MPPIGTILFGLALVIDGDTLSIDNERVRLLGIDAPELGQHCVRDEAGYDCGQEAAAWLAQFIGARRIICMVRDHEEGAALAHCDVAGQDIAAAVLGAGWAFALPKAARTYVGMEQAARLAGTGMWAGMAEAPWLWRKGRR